MNSICPNSPDLIEISDDEIMQNHDQNLQRDWGLGASAACQQQLLKDRGFLPLQQSLHPLFYRKNRLIHDTLHNDDWHETNL